jgi:UrcA family protein
MRSVKLSPKLCALMAGVAIAAAAAPVLAQDYYDEDVTVTGQRYYVPDSVTHLSQRVSYADLDLTRSYDRRVLRGRIDDSAAFLCDRMNESDDNLGVVPSCRTAAYQDGVQQARYVAGFARRGMWDSPARTAYTGSYPACTAYRHDNCVEVYTY